jgi:hypothetical protein
VKTTLLPILILNEREYMLEHLVDYTGQDLAEDEWLLKVRDDGVGFMTKLTQKKELPKAFESWSSYNSSAPMEIKVLKEDFDLGWKLNDGESYEVYRIGKSQSWVKLVHPLGFVLEIRIANFFADVAHSMNNGILLGEYKWVGNSVERR